MSAVWKLLIWDVTEQEVTALDEATNLVFLFYPESGILWIVWVKDEENNNVTYNVFVDNIYGDSNNFVIRITVRV